VENLHANVFQFVGLWPNHAVCRWCAIERAKVGVTANRDPARDDVLGASRSGIASLQLCVSSRAWRHVLRLRRRPIGLRFCCSGPCCAMLAGHFGVFAHRKKDGIMKASIMLADHAQAVGNKLFICGGGWSLTGPDPTPGALAVDLKIPWDRRAEEHTIRFDLFDSDGQPVLVPTPPGCAAVVDRGQVGDR
jgi:hypothetical protein